MPQFIDHIVNRAVTVLNNQFQRGPQFVAKIGRNADRDPVQIRVTIMEPFSFCIWQFGIRAGCADLHFLTSP